MRRAGSPPASSREDEAWPTGTGPTSQQVPPGTDDDFYQHVSIRYH